MIELLLSTTTTTTTTSTNTTLQRQHGFPQMHTLNDHANQQTMEQQNGTNLYNVEFEISQFDTGI